MKIGIIGAGFTGLAAAYTLTKAHQEVTIIEKDTHPGGLAIGFKEKHWNWTMEEHYHHWFTNDHFVLNLAKEIDFPVITKRPKTSVFLDNHLYQLDSPQAVLGFATLPLVDRLRMAATLAFLKFNPFWKPLEKIKATEVLPKLMGKKAWSMLWEPQLRNKMGKYADEISLVWFWTRINKRTPSLAYPEGGFLRFAEALAEKVTGQGAKILYNTTTTHISSEAHPAVTIQTNGISKKLTFDVLIVTLPSFLFLQLAPTLPDDYHNKLVKLKGLGATNMVLRLKKQFLTDGTYWLSICEKNAPAMVIVEHTNLMDKKYFNNEYLLYIGNYPEPTSEKFTADKKTLLKLYDPLLQRIHPHYEKDLIGYEVFKAPFAQPIVPTNYSRLKPPTETPLKNVYLANIEQVYPWDRGTNYAIELGENVAKKILRQSG